MLTRDDVTLADARAVYESVADTGLRHVGCKDVGLPHDELAALLDEVDRGGLRERLSAHAVAARPA
jgi:hypothetical protein